jgi:aconitase B
VVENLINGNDDDFYLDLLTHRIPPGVDEAAYVKASFLTSVTRKTVSLISFGNSFLLVNQSAFAQESTTCLAKVLLVDFSTML